MREFSSHLEIINEILDIIKNETGINKEERLKGALIALDNPSKKTNEDIVTSESIIKSKKILDLLAKNLPDTKNDPVKAAIFQIILNDCKKYYNDSDDNIH